MLKKRLGTEAIEMTWGDGNGYTYEYFKIPSTLIIPENVVELGRCVFSWCKNLRKVVIPGSVKTIDHYAFHRCDKLMEVELAEGILIIDSFAFDECENLKKVVIPESVLMLGDFVFPSCWRIRIESKKPSWLFLRTDSFLSRKVTIIQFKLNFKFIRRYFRYFKELFKFFFSSKSLIYEKKHKK